MHGSFIAVFTIFFLAFFLCFKVEIFLTPMMVLKRKEDKKLETVTFNRKIVAAVVVVTNKLAIINICYYYF